MSRSIILTNSTQENNYIPIASEGYFVKYLYPLAEELGLDYIMNMSGLGYDFYHHDLLLMISQFYVLKEYVSKSSMIKEPYENWFIEKINSIIYRLELEKDNVNIEGTVG